LVGPAMVVPHMIVPARPEHEPRWLVDEHGPNAILAAVIDDLTDIPAKLREAAAELPTLYDDPLHYDLLAQMTAPDDLPFYRDLLHQHGCPVLELGCGTGRVALALASEGADVVGVDLHPAMLALAREKAAQAEIGLTLALGDLRRFDLDQKFSLVLLTYNTLNHLLDLDSITRCFDTVKRHMDDGTRFVIDTFQPSLAFLGRDPERKRQILRYLDPYTQDEVRLHEENHYDPATQHNRVVWTYEVDGHAKRTEELVMRLFFPNELEALLQLSGFAIEARYGDYDRRPFGPTTPKQLTVCRLA